MQGFFAIPSPGFIYFIGAASGWKAPAPENAAALADWRLWESENAIGSGIYSAVFDIPAGQAQFRFYTELTKEGWDNKTASLGAREANDDNEDITLTDGSYQGNYVLGKGNWQIPDWTEDGKLTIIVNTVEKTVQFTKGAQQIYTPRYVYMVGNQAGWKEPSAANEADYEPWRLADLTESGIYTATFDFPADGWGNDGATLYCRFYKELSGCVAAQWASTTGENYPVTSGTAVATAEGEGCFMMENAAGHKVTITLDTTVEPATIKFEYAD